MYFCVTVDDVGMDGYSTPENLENLLKFWDSNNLKGTLFVVPRNNGKILSSNKRYVDILKDAVANGHEVALHGLDHARFQTGIPPKMVLDLPHEHQARKYLAENRDEIEKANSVENLRKILREARGILESALDIEIKGFRAPCLSTCENLFKALDLEGFDYDSSIALQTTAWDMINDPEGNYSPCDITKERFDSLQTCKNMIFLPLTADYTWYLKNDRYNAFVKLAKHDIDDCLKSEIPFVALSHVSPILEGDKDCGTNLYHELIDYAIGQSNEHGTPFIAETLFNTCSKVSF